MNSNDIFSYIFQGLAFLLLAIAIGGPFILTIANTVFLIKTNPQKSIWKKVKNASELLTWILGPFLMSCLFSISEIRYAGFEEQLTNREVHSPIHPGSALTIVVICVAACICYFFLRIQPGKFRAPLVTVLCIGGMYLGVFVNIMWILQVFYTPKQPFGDQGTVFLILFPINCIILVATRMRVIISEWKEVQEEDRTIFKNAFLNKLNDMLMDSSKWPLAGLIAALPVLGVITVIMVLFGQKPDAIIRAFTETSDWNLSTKISPPNLQYDEHYLCTVAAGGHRKIVKPLRKGYRHGHEVVVNRQLCIANAFEQILEEKTPKFHKAIRGFYDKYGFPVARLIRSRFVADVVYYIMKPLEWVFLIVIYLCDAKPENRIAMQYTK